VQHDGVVEIPGPAGHATASRSARSFMGTKIRPHFTSSAHR